jgi:hypothetical protein
VPGQQVRDRDVQGMAIQQSGQPNCDGNVVDRGLRLEPVQKPHPLLSHRQRDAVWAGSRRQRYAGTLPDLGFDPHGQRGHGGDLEQQANGHGGVESCSQPRTDLGRDQRVAAEREEVVIGTDTFDAQHFTEHAGDDLLHRCRRSAECARLHFGFG